MSIPSHSRRPSTSSQMAATEPQQRRRRMALETIQQVLQYMNTLSLMVGFLLILVGKFLLTWKFLKLGSYVISEETRVTGIASTTLPLCLVGLGGLVTVVSFLGCYGASSHDPKLLKVYFVTLFFCILTQILIGILGFYFRDRASIVLDRSWERAYLRDPHLIQDVENYFGCCGLMDVTDRPVPPNCSSQIKRAGPCFQPLLDAFNDSQQSVGIMGFLLGCLELLGLGLSGIMYLRILKELRGSETERRPLLRRPSGSSQRREEGLSTIEERFEEDADSPTAPVLITAVDDTQAIWAGGRNNSLEEPRSERE